MSARVDSGGERRFSEQPEAGAPNEPDGFCRAGEARRLRLICCIERNQARRAERTQELLFIIK